MYEFWYDYIKPKYQHNAELCYMDTDSFIIHIKTRDMILEYDKKYLKLYSNILEFISKIRVATLSYATVKYHYSYSFITYWIKWRQASRIIF